jgi:hypothetical protein
VTTPLDRLQAEQTAALASRAASHARLDSPDGVTSLLASLRAAGAHEQAAALVSRLPAAGMFGLFLLQEGPADQFHFGRQADGTPAAPWGWGDLDLCHRTQNASMDGSKSTRRASEDSGLIFGATRAIAVMALAGLEGMPGDP